MTVRNLLEYVGRDQTLVGIESRCFNNHLVRRLRYSFWPYFPLKLCKAEAAVGEQGSFLLGTIGELPFGKAGFRGACLPRVQ